METVTRHYKKPNGKLGKITVALCRCLARQHGPLGGMCVNCNGAITSVDEQRAINLRAWKVSPKTKSSAEANSG